jgi:ABC-type sugar transport system permease subunit
MTGMNPMTAKNKYRRRIQYKIEPYLFAAPAALLLFIAIVLPIFYAIFISLSDAKLLSLSSAHFIGIKNYFDFFTSTSSLKVFQATFVFVVLGVVFTYCVGMGMALVLNLPLKMAWLFRGIIILPWVVPQVVLVLIWKWMLNPQYGIINYLFSHIGLIPANFSWFGGAVMALVAVTLVTVWKQYPLACLMLLAGMKTIPGELHEAAQIDGANSIQRFWHVTLPGLRYVSSVLLLLLTIWSFANFVVIWLLTKGGPADRTATLSIFTYLNAFKYNKFGYGAAIGVMCLIISVVVTIIYFWLFNKQDRGTGRD